jgi:hypothetical protein
MASQRLSELLVQVQRNHRLRKIIQIASKNVGRIVNSITVPNQALAVSIRGVERVLQFLDTFLGAVESKYSLDASS